MEIYAGAVRVLVMDDTKAQAIYLCLGRSTVLRFPRKPQKIVAGNKNYFNFEFIARDIAIQPLREIPSNLFVYSKYQSYAFNLKFLNNRHCDDLVKIAQPKKSQRSLPVRFTLGDSLKVTIIPPMRINNHLAVIDVQFLNLGSEAISMKNVRGNLNRKQQRWVWEKDFLYQGKTTRGRILFDAREKGGLVFTIIWKEGHTINLPWGMQ